MAPGDRRHELQWSRDIMGMCEVTSFGVWISLDGMGGIIGRSERGGTLTVYRTAEQKQPPFRVKASFDSAKTSGLRANVIPAQHNDHGITYIRLSPPNACSNPRETECEPSNNSAHLSERYDVSTVDSGFPYSTNTSWWLNIEVNNFYDSSAWAESLDVYHSGRCLSTISSVSELEHDDTLGLPPLSGRIGYSSGSAPEIGNLESVPPVPADAPTTFDYGIGHDDPEFISFDDYIYPEFELSTSAHEGNAATPHSVQLPEVPNTSSLPALQPSVSSSSSELLLARESSGLSLSPYALASSKSASPASGSKLVLSPSSSFKCSVCHKAFAFESRLKSHLDTHSTFSCAFKGCNSTFTECRSRLRHIKSVHESKKYKSCEICGRGFNRKDKHDDHVKKCPTTGKKRKLNK
ncbi:hypothetical protein EG329_000893 [Mollisiaceae sp. DMI_Dod_QoI]|nr:hypothetical protein EG329_000893 [Helotiales sp. DMI_Dod_QoI]